MDLVDYYTMIVDPKIKLFLKNKLNNLKNKFHEGDPLEKDNGFGGK